MKTALLFFVIVGGLTSAVANAAEILRGEGETLPNSTIRIVRFVKPVFPLRLSRQGVATGEAKVAFELDARGRLVDLLPISYTHVLFAEATMAAMRSWRFEPAVESGQAAAMVGELTMRFETNGVLVVSKMANQEEDVGGKWVYQPCEPGRLDDAPRLVHVVEPYYPRQHYVEGASGAVALDFYIDERGHVRMPMVTGATEPMLAAITVAAVKQWRFAPPSSQGKPVLVHVKQSFRFTPKADG